MKLLTGDKVIPRKRSKDIGNINFGLITRIDGWRARGIWFREDRYSKMNLFAGTFDCPQKELVPCKMTPRPQHPLTKIFL